jgi:ubiquitin-protein ligase
MALKDGSTLNYEKLKEQDFLTGYAYTKPDVLKFLLKLTYKAAKSTRKDLIYNPAYPNLSNKLLEDDINSIIDLVTTFKEDKDLPFDKIQYEFIVFSVYATPIIFEKCSIINISKLEQFKVVNTYEQESVFRAHGKKTNFLFHGSRMENWYSMIKNGIKICSGTKLQLNGVVHGKGIYLSNSIQFAMGYSDSGIIGVFEVVGDREQYKKTNNIFVVPDETKLMLRYFLSYNNRNKNDIIIKINDFFKTGIHKKKEAIKKKKVTFSNGRLMNELKNILGDKFQMGDDIYSVKVIIRPEDFDKDLTLYHDLIKYKIPYVELEMIIPKAYPFEPPFVWVKNPVFKNRTGHVTDGGSICVDFLTAVSWSPCLDIQKTTINIISLLSGGEIDYGTKRKYTRKTAQSSYNRVARDHGWLR